MKYFPLLILLFVTIRLTAQSTVESIPNQKLVNGSYVSNPDNILDKNIVSRIDTLLRSLEQKTSVQVAVVAVESIGDADIFEFAQELFTAWGIGNNDNGLLVLLVKDIHNIRFHTGYGVEGMLPDVVCKRIQREYMVPEFKRGNYNEGMLAGLTQVEKILTDPASAEELNKAEGEEVSAWVGFVTLFVIIFVPLVLISYIVRASKGRFRDSKKRDETPYPEMWLTRWIWLLEFAAIPIFIVTLFGLSGMENAAATGWCFISLYFYFMATLFHRLRRVKKVINRFLKTQDYYEIVEFLRKQQWYWFFMAVLFPVPFVFYFIYHLGRKRIYRNHPRKCKQCMGRMNKLTERTEDAYLTEGQKMEETLRAVDYDVWQCEACQSVEMWFYLNRHSRYEPCPKCNTIAYHFVSRRTVVSASYSSSGSGEEVHACKFCGYQAKSSYSIARLERSVSSSSSSGSSFGSGSSSSGGSWGGGRSGGGGATSSW